MIVSSFLLTPMERGSPILVAGWSLTHELLFYIIVALLIAFRGMWIKIIIAIWALAVFVTLCLSFNQIYAAEFPGFNVWMRVLLWPQNFEFILGAAAAWLLARQPAILPTRRMALIILPASWLLIMASGLAPGILQNIQAGKHVLYFGVLSFLIVQASVVIDKSGGLSAQVRRSGVFRLQEYLGGRFLLHLSGAWSGAVSRLQNRWRRGVVSAFSWMARQFRAMLIGRSRELFVSLADRASYTQILWSNRAQRSATWCHPSKERPILMRLAVVVSHPIQYYGPMFRLLATRCDLTVFYCLQMTAQQQAAAGFGTAFDWDLDLLSGYKSEFLRNVSQTPGTEHFRDSDTPEIGDRLRKGRFDALLVIGWHLKSYLQALLAAKRIGIPVLVRGDSHLETPRTTLKRYAKAIINPVFLRLFDGALYVGTKSRAFYQHYGYPEHRLFPFAALRR